MTQEALKSWISNNAEKIENIMIPYGRQEITEGDVDAVVDVLRSDFLTQGPIVPLFEKAVRSHVGAITQLR